MADQHLRIARLTTEEILQVIKTETEGYAYDFRKHQIQIHNASGDQIGVLRLPLHILINENLDILNEEALAVYLTIESGNAAICVMEGEENIYHTTFKAYMTRKKQGFSQIKYLNKKGKSRAGSRIRLAGSVEFFENINTALNELWEEFEFDRIALDCTKTLLPHLFQSKVPFPVDMKDQIIYKIPLHIPQSNFTNLEAAIEKLKCPSISFKNEHTEELTSLFD